VGKNGNGNNICPDCKTKLIAVKLYAPEILRMFEGGQKSYTKNNILVDYQVCLNSLCSTGHRNLESHERVVESGMIRME
jgi:hypothetical protein